jgi:hypothetical protein
MKKYIYSLAMLVLGLTGCATWDDPVTENYGEGPAIAIEVTQTTDSAVTFTLTPAAGTQFYNFITDMADEAEELDASALLKGSYGNVANVKKTADAPTFTYTIAAEPNTTYQIYAVAASDKGIVGKVAVASATTTDQKAPQLVDDAFEPIAADKAVTVTFNQDIVRGAGAVTGAYYKEWDWENTVALTADDIQVEVDGNTATISAPETPAGAFVIFSWEQGAFTDAIGNKCGQFATVYDEESDDFLGAAVHNANVAFAIADSMVTAPADGALISNVADFKGEITLPFNIYRNNRTAKSGDLTVTFTGDKHMSIYKLEPENWSVADKVLTFTLPATPEAGDIITVQVAEGVIFDVMGNANEAFESETSWKFFAPQKENVFGTFDLTYTYTYQDKQYTKSLGTVTIVENPTDENPTGILVKDFYLEGSELEGYYDLANGKVFIFDGQVLGIYTTSKGTKYGCVFYNYDNKTDDLIPVPFTMNADGTMTSDAHWGIFAYDEAYKEALGWLDACDSSVLTPVAPTDEPAAARRVSSKQAKVTLKAHANRSLKKYVVR